MKTIFKILIISILFIPSLSWAVVDLPWSTTFNCDEWNQDEGNPICVDSGIEKYGGWHSCPSGRATGGTTEKLIDTTVNFVTAGIIVGNYVRNQVLNENREITSITTTTSANDTLNFTAMTGTNASGNTYYIYDASISTPPTFYDHSLAKLEQITSGANHPLGGGGRGQRHWLGDGENVGSGGLNISFNTPQTEIWIRWYMKFQTGFKWSDYAGFKIIYLKANSVWGNYFMVGYNSNSFTYTTQYGDSQNRQNIDAGWSQTFCGGGTESDGSWHSLEFHIKSETGPTPNNTDGIVQWWVDGVLKGNYNNVDHGLNSLGYTIDWILIGSNAKYPDNGLIAYYVDYDDISINNTGYIGPLSGSLTLGSGGSISLGSGGNIKF